MYRVYAADPRMRINLGIRRRLAPLLGNDRRKIELMNGLLLLAARHAGPLLRRRDRHGRQRLPRRPQRRAHADAVEPPTATPASARPTRSSCTCRWSIDPEYHYETINVEAQDRNPSSLLWWMRRIIALRQQHPAFGRGDIEFLYPDNAQGAGLRAPPRGRDASWWSPTCRASPRACELDLHDYRGATPVELFGGNEFPVDRASRRTTSRSAPTTSTGSSSTPTGRSRASPATTRVTCRTSTHR